MRAISLWQPWASLWLSPSKIHETRHWAIAYRGWLVVHAAKRMERDVGFALQTILTVQFGRDWATTLPTGALLGMVNLTACERTESIRMDEASDDYACGDFSFGRYGWHRDKWIRFREPIPFKGKQGLFNVPTDLIEEARHAA